MRRFLLLCACIGCCITLSAKNVFKFYIISDEEKTCYVAKSGTNYIGKVEIPSTAEFDNRDGLYTVTEIGEFKSCADVTEFVLPKTIKKIRNYAFDSCTKMSKIELSEGLESIGGYAFNETSLEEIYIPNSVTKIGAWAFYQCRNLKKAYIGNGVSNLGDCQFIACDSLDTFYVGSGLVKITTSCFKAGSSYHAPKTVVILSNNIDSGSSFIDAETIYVPNPEYYAESLPKYSELLKPIAELKVPQPTIYTGLSPIPNVKTEMEDLVITTTNNLPFESGNHSVSAEVDVSYNGWGDVIELPCTYTIEKAPLTIMANNASIYYGEVIPSFTYSGIGFVNNETAEVLDKQPSIITTATSQSDADTYPIIPSGAEAKNYEISYERGTLTILKAKQTITWEPNFSNTPVGELIELSATSSSGLPVKFKSLDLSTAIITTSDGKSYIYPIKEGKVVIAAYQDGDKNYEAADEVYNVLSIGQTSENALHLTFLGIEGGKVSIEVEKGKAYTIDLIPDDEWALHSVSFNGEDVSSSVKNNIYTTPAISTNSELHIVFENIGTDVKPVFDKDESVRVKAHGSSVEITNAKEATMAYIYSVDGKFIKSEDIGIGTTSIYLSRNNRYIVKIGNSSYKFAL